MRLSSSRAGPGLLLLLLLLAGCEQVPLLERLQWRGTIAIGTVSGPLTCQLGVHGPEGVEYALASAFAESLGLAPRFRVYPTRAAALDALRRGEVQMVAAARQASSRDQTQFLLSRPWHRTPLHFVSTMGSRRVRDPASLPSTWIAVPRESLQEELLQALENAPVWPLPHTAEETILELVDAGAYRYTLVDALLLQAWQSYRPRLVRGAAWLPPRGFRWFFSRLHDPSLRDAADRFLARAATQRLVQRLLQRQILDAPKHDFVCLRDFWQNLAQRLPKYESMFREAEKETGIDWRLLAAIAYQESHWRSRAVSPTGVKGIMMLTLAAARHEKVSNRLDPAQSIAGGARYLLWMERRIPDRIQGLDRLWLTLAGYNIGYGHLEDARVLTQRGGGDPDRWRDVKRFLPLLAKKKYYTTVKHGRARGGEPVAYVERIRDYYRLLVWWDNRRQGLDCTSHRYPRLALKNWRRRSPQLSANTPPSTRVQ